MLSTQQTCVCCHCWGHRCPNSMPWDVQQIEQNPLPHVPEVWNKGQDKVPWHHQAQQCTGEKCLQRPDWYPCLYRLWHYQCIRWPGEDDSLEADKVWQGLPTSLHWTWSFMGSIWRALWEAARDHLPYVPSFHPHNTCQQAPLQIFCAKRAEVDSIHLPPYEDCLSMHILRANYQAAIWRRCLKPSPFGPSPTDCRWTTDENGNLVVEWMRGSPAPDTVLQLLSCKCVRSCKLPVCTCLSNGLKCTDMCRLQICSNQATEEEP